MYKFEVGYIGGNGWNVKYERIISCYVSDNEAKKIKETIEKHGIYNFCLINDIFYQSYRNGEPFMKYYGSEYSLTKHSPKLKTFNHYFNNDN